MARHEPGSTARLLELCGGYFASYVLTGILVKYFTVVRQPAMPEFAYLFNNTLASAAVCLLAVLALRWPGRLAATSNRMVSVAGLRIPAETAYIVPSGVCTAIVIPTTTLMYSLPISVMVAMVIMRGAVIVISRAVDEIQIRQRILDKRVFHEENVAVVFALLAVATNLLLLPVAVALHGRGIDVPAWLGVRVEPGRSPFDFVRNPLAMTILTLYVLAYAARIYIMNYYKNTRGRGIALDNRGFFAVEQISASVVMLILGVYFAAAPAAWGWRGTAVVRWSEATKHLDPVALVAGIPYALVAFFSVFIFMFQGRTATFAGLVNRLTSLLAGTAATLILWVIWAREFPKQMRFPTGQEWLSVAFILVAVYFLTRAEQRRAAERAQAARPA
jgi:hypothetical protein